MNPDDVEPEPEPSRWRLRVFKRDGTWRIRVTVNGEPWGAIPYLFATHAEALAFARWEARP